MTEPEPVEVFETMPLAFLQLQQARRYIRAWCRWACGGSKGRGKLDPVYVKITEGRDPKRGWAGFSSCGELSQALVQHMGVRLPFVNRAPHWRPGRNLLDFYDKAHVPSAPAIRPPRDYVPSCGDVGFIWRTGFDAHTFVFGDWVSPSQIETFNYGAGGMSPTEFPGAKQSLSELRQRHISAKGAATFHPYRTEPAAGARVESQIYLGSRILEKVLVVPTLLEILDSDYMPEMTPETILALEALVDE